MKKLLLVTLALLIAPALIACAAAPNAQPRTLIAPSIGIAPPAVESRGADVSGEQSKGANADAPTTERMIVRTVSMNLEVQDTEKSFNEIAAIAAQFKGYIAQTNLRRNSKNHLQGSVTLRLPAESLDAALKQIKATSLQVLIENSNSNDVTDQYSDLAAQLKNLEATETELRKLLETVREKSGKADEILAVYNRLTQIRTQIEQTKGRINVLEKTTALATVTIELTPHEDVEIVDPDRWLPDRTAREALRALVQALQGFANLVIWFALFVLPVLLSLLAPFGLIALVVRSWARRRQKKSA